MGVIDLRRRARLALESPQRCLVAKERSDHDLGRNVPMQSQVRSLVHRAEPPATQRAIEPVLAFQRPLDRQRQHELSAVRLAALGRAVETAPAAGTLLQQRHAPIIEPRENIAPNVGIQAYALLQMLVLIDEANLHRETLQQVPVRRGIRFLRFPLAKQEDANQPIARPGDGHDQAHAELRQPLPLLAWQGTLHSDGDVADRLVSVQQPQQRLLCAQLRAGHHAR